MQFITLRDTGLMRKRAKKTNGVAWKLAEFYDTVEAYWKRIPSKLRAAVWPIIGGFVASSGLRELGVITEWWLVILVGIAAGVFLARMDRP